MEKVRLIKRLAWYYPMEKFHAFISFPLVIVILILNNSCEDIIFLLYGLCVCVFILHQGQLYWKIKLKKLRGQLCENNKSFNAFRQYHSINRFLIFLIPAILLLQFYLSEWKIHSKSLLIWGVLANLFAIIEYINYYHWQVSVDNKSDLDYLIKNRRFKEAHLLKDLRKNAM